MSTNFSVQGAGSSIVLVHGSMATKEQWYSLSKVLAERHKVIASDLMGYGNTAPPKDPDSYGLKDESALLETVLAKVLKPGEPYHLVGHSYGGAVALHHAYYLRDRVMSLTVIEPMSYHLLPKHHDVLIGSKVMIREVTADITRGAAEDGARKFIDLWSRPGTYDNLREREKMALCIGVAKMIYDFKAAAEDSLTLADYATLPMPICLITGKESPAISLCISDLIADSVPGVHHFRVDGGHFAPFTHGHLVHPIVTTFIEKTSIEGKPLKKGSSCDLEQVQRA